MLLAIFPFLQSSLIGTIIFSVLIEFILCLNNTKSFIKELILLINFSTKAQSGILVICNSKKRFNITMLNIEPLERI